MFFLHAFDFMYRFIIEVYTCLLVLHCSSQVCAPEAGPRVEWWEGACLVAHNLLFSQKCCAITALLAAVC